MSNLFGEKYPWEYTTDEYFGVDTPVKHDRAGYQEKDFAGQVVFIKTSRDIADAVLRGEIVKWAEIAPNGILVASADRETQSPVKADQGLLLYKLSPDVRLLNQGTDEWHAFMNRYGTSWNSLVENQLATFGEGYHGIVHSGEINPIAIYNMDIISQGQLYPLPRFDYLQNMQKKGCKVPHEILTESINDQHIEDEYRMERGEFEVSWKIDVDGLDVKDAAEQTLNYMASADSRNFEIVLVNKKTKDEFVFNLGDFGQEQDEDADSGMRM